MTVGLILVTVLSLINFASHFATCAASQVPTWFVFLIKQESLIDWTLTQPAQCPAATAVTLWFDSFFFHTSPSGYLMTSFAITLACSIFAALICLELTGRYGNRLKAVPAIWCALLFNFYPPVLQFVSRPIPAREYELNCLFLLVTAFALCRWFLLKEKLYIAIALAGVILLTANGFAREFALPQPGLLATLSERFRFLLFPEPSASKGFWIAAALPVYLSIAGLFVFRICLARERLRPIALCLAWLLAIVCFCKPIENQTGYSPSLFYAIAPLSLALSLLAFPLGAQLKLSHSRIIAFAGLSAVLLLALIWAKMTF